MIVNLHTVIRIAPVSRSDRVRDRDSRVTSETTVDQDTESDAPARAGLPRVIRPETRDEPARQPGIPGPLAAQVIAQKLQTKSDRRLARYFPERVNGAYRMAAGIVATQRPRSGRSA